MQQNYARLRFLIMQWEWKRAGMRGGLNDCSTSCDFTSATLLRYPTPRLSLTCLLFRHSMLAHDRPDHLALPGS